MMNRKAAVVAGVVLVLSSSACRMPGSLPTDRAASGAVTIEVLSNRADLISDGDALVRIDMPAGSQGLQVMLGDRDITNEFLRPDSSHAVGLVEDMAIGENELVARIAGGRGARLTITNHPKGGPVIAGPQILPWLCTTAENGLGDPLDDQCNAPTQVTYMYQPEGADPGKYEAYDPANPPSDVAMTTTDAGVEVPYIIRQEKGTLNRTIYRLMVLADPAQPWTGPQPQSAWNRKLFVSFGGGCGTPYKQTIPPETGGAFGNTPDDGQIQLPELLSRGWMTVGAGTLTLNQNSNETVSAETVMMLKEHIVDRYGEIGRTVSAGGSGGSVQQHFIASAYPGLLNGIVPTQSFPDLWGLVWDGAECSLLTRYFLSTSPHLWLLPWQQSAVTGKTGPVACTEFVALLNDAFDPQNRGLLQLGVVSVRPGCQIPEAQRYHPTRNPTGARCSVQDYQKAVWGHSGPTDAAPIPYDNTGVQYGLNALEAGTITPEQFVDLNLKVGGIDNEGNYTAQRASMDASLATIMYRASRTSDPRQLAKVPIIDVRQALVRGAPESLSDMHQPYHSQVMRARLDAVNGTHDNQVTWNAIPENMAIPAILDIDRWLQAIAGDDRNLSQEQKVIQNKPADVVDTCWISGDPVTDASVCGAKYTYGNDPRISAGAPFRNDMRKCQLKPLSREEYTVTFSDAQWQRLQDAFPDGVCDWSLPSVGYQPSIPWMTYANGPGGSPLQAAPFSTTY